MSTIRTMLGRFLDQVDAEIQQTEAHARDIEKRYEDLRKELDKAIADVEHWENLAIDQEHRDWQQAESTVPRVITADEVKPGMTVACTSRSFNTAGVVTSSVRADYVKLNRGPSSDWVAKRGDNDTRTWWLLPNTPNPAPQPSVGDEVCTVKQLEALPESTVFRSRVGELVETGYIGSDMETRIVWRNGAWFDLTEAIDHFAPLTILYRPNDGGNDA